MNASFTAHDIRRLLELLSEELATAEVEGELYLVGGAVMCLAFDARRATREVDALFRPTREIREAAARVADRAGVPRGWLNNAVKGYLDERGAFDPFLELPNLRVFIARPEYLLAMKCASMRLAEEFRDVDDIRYLLRYLNITSVDQALEVVVQYVDEDRLMPKTRLALEELLSG
ncbi:MAG TPA: hypothetical protein VK929_12775 [Longimicrobiales bacterium]|nr:hypothetical protein [Longimicrobiales bacterium]